MDVKTQARFEARAGVLKAMAHPSRLYIVELVSKNKMCVKDLTDKIGADMSTVSKHLTILKNAGIVGDEKKGSKIFYRLKMPCVLSFFSCIESVLKESGKELIKLSE